MDRHSDIRTMLAAISIDDVIKLRELAIQTGLVRLQQDADNELRRRSVPEIESRMRPYRATLRRVP
jgi:hypothetical protein